MFDFLLQKKGTVRSASGNVIKQTYLKTTSVAVKVSPSAKSHTVKTFSVTTVVNPATYGNDNEV